MNTIIIITSIRIKILVRVSICISIIIVVIINSHIRTFRLECFAQSRLCSCWCLAVLQSLPAAFVAATWLRFQT